MGLVLASILVSRQQMCHPSLAYAITQGKALGRTMRASLFFVLMLAFYYFVYNTILEWLEFVLDDPIIVIGILLYIHSLAARKERFHTESFVFRIAEFSEGIYSRFVSM